MACGTSTAKFEEREDAYDMLGFVFTFDLIFRTSTHGSKL
jgi:hypothetical protein